MKIGLVDHVEDGSRPVAQLYDERIEFAVTAEDAGHTLSVSLTLHTDGYLDAHPLLSIGAVAVSSPGPGEGAGPGTPPSSNPSDPPASQQPLPTLVRSGHGKPALIRHGHTVRLALKAKRLRKLVVPSAASLGFQWYRGSARIVGATEADHRLRTADRGKRLRILVTLTRPGYQPLRLWTRWVRVRG